MRLVTIAVACVAVFAGWMLVAGPGAASRSSESRRAFEPEDGVATPLVEVRDLRATGGTARANAGDARRTRRVPMMHRMSAAAGGRAVAEPPVRELTPEQRIQHSANQYFAEEVWPRVRPCFSRLSNGHVLLVHRFVQDGGGAWIPAEREASVELQDSTLPEGEDAIALECMRRAMEGTSFPVIDVLANDSENVLYWRWPTPRIPAYDERLAMSPIAH